MTTSISRFKANKFLATNYRHIRKEWTINHFSAENFKCSFSVGSMLSSCKYLTCPLKFYIEVVGADGFKSIWSVVTVNRIHWTGITLGQGCMHSGHHKQQQTQQWPKGFIYMNVSIRSEIGQRGRGWIIGLVTDH